MSPTGIAFTFSRAARVEGTEAGLPFGTPQRNDEFVNTENNAAITREFEAIASGGKFVAKLTGQDLLLGGIKDLIDQTIEAAAKELAKEAASAVIALVAA
jgi:hypothetical protein